MTAWLLNECMEAALVYARLLFVMFKELSPVFVEHDAKTVFTLTEGFSTTAKQLTEVVNAVALAISTVTQTLGQGASGAEEVAAASGNVSSELEHVSQTMAQLSEQASMLSEEISKFKV